MRRRPGWIALTLVLQVPLAQGGHKIRVTAGDHAIRQLPVSVAIPDALAGKPIRLVQPGDQEVPVQIDASGAKPAAVWIVDHLPAGGTIDYLLEVGDPATTNGKGVKLIESNDGLDIQIDGQLFTRYWTNAGPKPYCWPILGPTGAPVTRAYPMKTDVEGEAKDHPHHRSFWFTHGKVNGNDFWSESERAGSTRHRKFERVISGPVFGEFVSRVDWLSKQGEKVCEDVRTMRIYRVEGERLFDFAIAMSAGDRELFFGDDKEGTFGFRVASSMDVDAAKRGASSGGTLVNAEGLRNGDVWGKRSAWCDYSGPVEGKIVGVAILDHPQNFRHPTYWHARTYGLFCANPFGIGFFTNDKKNDGSHRVPSGQTFHQRYRIVIHPGDSAEGGIADAFAGYANPPKVVVD